MDRFIPNRSASNLDVASYVSRESRDVENMDALSPTKASARLGWGAERGGAPQLGRWRSPGGRRSRSCWRLLVAAADRAFNAVLTPSPANPPRPPLQLEYKKQLAANLGQDGSARILAFKQKAPAPPEGLDNPMASLYTANAGPKVKKTFRAVPQQPDRILDAPDLVDDYYLNLLDWGSNNAVGAKGSTGGCWRQQQRCAPPANCVWCTPPTHAVHHSRYSSMRTPPAFRARLSQNLGAGPPPSRRWRGGGAHARPR